MIALFGFFEELDVVVEFFLAEKGGAIDADELFAGGVRTPIGAGDLGKLVIFQPTGAGDVRASAEIDEFAVFVEGESFAALGDFVDQFHLELVVSTVDGTVAGVMFVGFVDGGGAPAEGMILFDDLGHLGLDLGEVVGSDFPFGEIDVVVEAIIDDRADGELRLRKDSQNGVGHQVGAAMAKNFEGFAILLGQNADCVTAR